MNQTLAIRGIRLRKGATHGLCVADFLSTCITQLPSKSLASHVGATIAQASSRNTVVAMRHVWLDAHKDKLQEHERLESFLQIKSQGVTLGCCLALAQFVGQRSLRGGARDGGVAQVT